MKLCFLLAAVLTCTATMADGTCMEQCLAENLPYSPAQSVEQPSLFSLDNPTENLPYAPIRVTTGE